MKLGRLAIATLLMVSLGLALQGGFQGGYGRQQMYYQSGANVPSEFYWTRLQYTSNYGDGGGYGWRRFGGWSRDYPKADNDCLIALRRLTHINSPSPLNVIDLHSDHVFDYPWIYAVQVNTWTFAPDEAQRLHDYLLKGGFLMVDDFHGTDDWQHFMQGMRMVTDRPVEDLANADEIYHVLYDIDEKFQIPSEVYVNTGRTYEKDGYVPKWRAIRDDHGRIMVAICANMHLGRCLGVGRQPAVSREVFRTCFSHRPQLHNVRHDSLGIRGRLIV
ncbi:MAG: DUF4159 domain-containing protein [Ignavibacteriota bacterium]